jgi:hypothetical protein
VREVCARFAGNKVKRTSANLMRRIRKDEGYFIYAPLASEINFDCYAGYGMSDPDGYPTIVVGLYVDPQAAGSEVAISAMKRISSLTGWDDNLSDRADWPEVWRETSLVSLLPEEEHHVAAVKHFFTESISQLKEELTAFKKECPGLPWRLGLAKDD